MYNKTILRSLIFAATVLFSVSAFAIDLDSAKQQGLVGETPSGYLASVNGSASGEVQGLINNINAKRKEQYSQIAQKNGTSLSAVEALAAKKAIENTKAGHYVLSSSGSWTKK